MKSLITWLQPLKENKFRIPKSRYDSVDYYISTGWMNRPEYNDMDVPFDQPIYERLRDHGKFNNEGTSDVL
jgi:glutamate--cysteine ligase catalytic subunit